ncbi:hypothetical protein [Roseovarius sp. MMSF_3281]|uniref:hypothetical protein n=1 Tax=Roseovarius sp. MMSF_3281 TaxID=3046694 RepID=UPI00273F2AEE|nr:hypothetical protein [Roseovarius sp. MMSF_3281]
MTNAPEEPTSLQAADMLLKMAALLGASVVCVKAIDRFFECVPQGSWLDVFGPGIFAALAMLFAGRILIWNMLGSYIAAIPNWVIRLLVRAALCGGMVFALSTTASVFSPLFAGQGPEDCPKYTIFSFY